MGEMTTYSAAQMQDLHATLGMNDQQPKSKNRLPELKISSKRRDEAGNDIRDFEGYFWLKNYDEEVYSDKVKIRVLSQLYQWIDYDPEAQRPRNRTLMIPFLSHQAIDETGTVRCGKPLSKVMKDWSKDQKAKYATITLFRQLRCLVSYTGKTAAGEEVTVENVPAIIMNKKTSYMNFEDEVIKKLNGRNYSDFWCDLSTNEHQNGDVTYYTWHYKPDLKNPVAMDDTTMDTLAHFASMVKAENEDVKAKYEAALSRKSMDDDILEALEDDLDADLAD
jgi:hypothetical protein